MDISRYESLIDIEEKLYSYCDADRNIKGRSSRWGHGITWYPSLSASTPTQIRPSGALRVNGDILFSTEVFFRDLKKEVYSYLVLTIDKSLIVKLMRVAGLL